jgi:hypothetical protein
MPTNTAFSTQKFQNNLPSKAAVTTIRRATQALHARATSRFAKISALAFAVTFPVLGIVDPKVLLASGLADAHTGQVLFSRVEAALRNMAVMEQLMTGGAAVLVVAAVGAVGYLRTRYKATGQVELAVE